MPVPRCPSACPSHGAGPGVRPGARPMVPVRVPVPVPVRAPVQLPPRPKGPHARRPEDCEAALNTQTKRNTQSWRSVPEAHLCPAGGSGPSASLSPLAPSGVDAAPHGRAGFTEQQVVNTPPPPAPGRGLAGNDRSCGVSGPRALCPPECSRGFSLKKKRPRGGVVDPDPRPRPGRAGDGTRSTR